MLSPLHRSRRDNVTYELTPCKIESDALVFL